MREVDAFTSELQPTSLRSVPGQAAPEHIYQGVQYADALPMSHCIDPVVFTTSATAPSIRMTTTSSPSANTSSDPSNPRA